MSQGWKGDARLRDALVTALLGANDPPSGPRIPLVPARIDPNAPHRDTNAPPDGVTPLTPWARKARETTHLPAALEAEFRQWAGRLGVSDYDHPQSFYDYRGAFLAGLNRDTESQHWPDQFKQHGHPTFSVESQYSRGPLDGVRWTSEHAYIAPGTQQPDATRTRLPVLPPRRKP